MSSPLAGECGVCMWIYKRPLTSTLLFSSIIPSNSPCLPKLDRVQLMCSSSPENTIRHTDVCAPLPLPKLGLPRSYGVCLLCGKAAQQICRRQLNVLSEDSGGGTYGCAFPFTKRLRSAVWECAVPKSREGFRMSEDLRLVSIPEILLETKNVFLCSQYLILRIDGEMDHVSVSAMHTSHASEEKD
jgi:hypothetical protein